MATIFTVITTMAQEPCECKVTKIFVLTICTQNHAQSFENVMEKCRQSNPHRVLGSEVYSVSPLGTASWEQTSGCTERMAAFFRSLALRLIKMTTQLHVRPYRSIGNQKNSAQRQMENVTYARERKQWKILIWKQMAEGISVAAEPNMRRSLHAY